MQFTITRSHLLGWLFKKKKRQKIASVGKDMEKSEAWALLMRV